MAFWRSISCFHDIGYGIVGSISCNPKITHAGTSFGRNVFGARTCLFSVDISFSFITTKNLNIKNILTLISALFLFSGCPPEDDVEKACIDAIIIWAGAPAVDGCGWLIEINDIDFKAESVPDSFQIDSLAVCIAYEPIDSIQCGFVSYYPGIRILEIE